MRIGYARPSVLQPDAELQVKALQDAGAEKIYTENVLSNEADRPAFEEALGSLGAGDTLIVASLDRLARTTTELFYIIEEIIKRGAAFASLKEALDTSADDGEAGRVFLRTLGAITEFERAILKEWQRESIEAAKTRRGHESKSGRRRR
ncbi:Resolvase domain-containing protein (fragment) [uncultured spirochete]|jgi:DNA invertase Pin-like site-specific DNA recombinase|uniref:Resolvase domain-containing protein n=1 Tax=uncultured spirochete TaxID=156406 RepID=A0A3P3XHX0_9SPIR